jgi:hypothetical protein
MVQMIQVMPRRKSGGLAPAMVLPKMVLPKMVLPKMVRTIMVLPKMNLLKMARMIAQTCLRPSLPRRFRVIKIAINHPNKRVFAGFAMSKWAF